MLNLLLLNRYSLPEIIKSLCAGVYKAIFDMVGDIKTDTGMAKLRNKSFGNISYGRMHIDSGKIRCVMAISLSISIRVSERALPAATVFGLMISYLHPNHQG